MHVSNAVPYILYIVMIQFLGCFKSACSKKKVLLLLFKKKNLCWLYPHIVCHATVCLISVSVKMMVIFVFVIVNNKYISEDEACICFVMLNYTQLAITTTYHKTKTLLGLYQIDVKWKPLDSSLNFLIQDINIMWKSSESQPGKQRYLYRRRLNIDPTRKCRIDV